AGEVALAVSDAFMLAEVAPPLESVRQDPAQNVEAECPSAVRVLMSPIPAAAESCRARRSATPPAPISAARPRTELEGPLPDDCAFTGGAEAEARTGVAAARPGGESVITRAAATGRAGR